MDTKNNSQGMPRARSMQSAQSVQFAQPMQPAQSVQPVQPVQPAQSVQFAQPMQPAQPVQPMQPARPAKPIQSSQSVQSVQPTQSAQPEQSMQPVQPIGQTESQPVTNSSSMGRSVQSKSKMSKKMIGIIVAVAVLVIAILIVVIVLLSGNGGGAVSLASVKKYCEEKQLQISEGTVDTEPKAQYIACQTADYYSSDSSDDNIMISFAIYEKPVMEYEEFASIREMMTGYGEVLKESGNYLKIYSSGSGNVAYLIIDGSTYMQLTAKNNDVAKKALIAMGYPDADWSTSSDDANSRMEDSLSRRAGRDDTERRNDMARLDTALVQYQMNNSNRENNLPEGPVYWEGTDTFDCESNIACQFVRDYVSTDSDTNTFLDPGGFLYNVYITENLALNETIKTEFGNDYSKLIKGSNGYMIGGSSPFDQHVVYILPGGACSEGGGGVIASQAKNFAIMYMLENSGLYCLDNK